MIVSAIFDGSSGNMLSPVMPPSVMRTTWSGSFDPRYVIRMRSRAALISLQPYMRVGSTEESVSRKRLLS